MKQTETFIYGKHAVSEALKRRPDCVVTLYLSHEFDDQSIRDAARQNGVKIEAIQGKKLPGGVPDTAVHQGIIARILSVKLLQDYKSFMNELAISNDTSVAVLGELQDPHNVGAVIRSAAAFGVAAVIIPEHRQAQLTGSVIKVSAGMAFSVPLVSVGNVNTTLKDLKDRGFWVYGLSLDAEQSLFEESFTKPTAFVFGNEGEGIREKTQEACDVLLRIPMHKDAESLNASASAAVVFAQWSQQHPGAIAAEVTS